MLNFQSTDIYRVMPNGHVTYITYPGLDGKRAKYSP